MLDWIALWEVDPWGPDRDDLRAAVQSYWNRGGDLTAIGLQFPYCESSDSDADEDEIIAMLEQDAAEAEENDNGTRTRTA